jgi:chromosome segregation protein
VSIPKNKGASFHKCDFQVHTLRDAGWQGPFHPINDRDNFARALVSDCRRKGIHAIAITDHHDLCLWRSISNAAQTEQKPDNSLYPEDERLVVFPGVELTLSSPSCQILLILDSDLPDATLAHIWGALGVIPSAETEPKTTQTVALSIDHTIKRIDEALSQIRLNPDETDPNKFRFLGGKFILLPNVKVGGHRTLLRPGNHTAYATMPFVGGYIEACDYSSLGVGDRNVLEGKVQAYGHKSVGVFQTSDCRAAQNTGVGAQQIVEFTNLGQWPTWVKWALPSTEALRQACLAKQSRISHAEPVYPLLQIVGVKVSDSLFLGTIELGLSPQFNAFIGGRGTGKSSLLEYIRWALCDDPGAVSDLVELPNFQKRRKALVDDTLKPSAAKVTVFYKKNEVIYQIERTITAQDDTVVVTDPSGVSQQMSPAQVRREFPLVSYAQKQLSCVGTLPDEINRLITDPVKERLAQVEDRIENAILPQLKEQRVRELRLANLNAQLTDAASSIKGKKEQVQALQKQLQALSPQQQTIISSHEILTQQDHLVTRAAELPGKLAEILQQTRNQVNATGEITPPADLPNVAEVQTVASSANTYMRKILAELDALINEANSGSWLDAAGRQVLEKLQKAYVDYKQQYDECVKASSKNQKQLDEMQNLNKQISDLESKQGTFEAERNALKAVLDSLAGKPWADLIATVRERADILQEQCRIIGDQAQHEFKPDVAFCGDDRPVQKAVDALVQGKNVRGSDEKVGALAQAVANATHPIEKWREVMAELDTLLTSKETSTLPSTPLLTNADFTSTNLESLRNGVTQDELEQIRFLNIKDRIVFSFRLGKKPDGSDNYVPFNTASPGQQATCLLRTLLAQSGAPLLIDQPEEDLDNEQIHVLSERISETKHNRQLLFVSHNANIVVNGDAELVACYAYRDPNDNTRGKIDPVGSIDCKPVRETITSVMEGGRRAFELRKQKYGF